MIDNLLSVFSSKFKFLDILHFLIGKVQKNKTQNSVTISFPSCSYVQRNITPQS